MQNSTDLDATADAFLQEFAATYIQARYKAYRQRQAYKALVSCLVHGRYCKSNPDEPRADLLNPPTGCALQKRAAVVIGTMWKHWWKLHCVYLRAARTIQRCWFSYCDRKVFR